jgi:DNA-binding MarR family transcriptional regulator
MSLEPLEPPASDADTIAQTLRRLRGASALVDRAVARALEPHGLTTAQYEVLKVMAQAEDEALGCRELGKRLSGPSPDVTRLLNRLEYVALVSRIRDENDRRVVHTRITEKGREVLSLAAPAVHIAESQAFAGLVDSDREQLARLLANVQINLAGN